MSIGQNLQLKLVSVDPPLHEVEDGKKSLFQFKLNGLLRVILLIFVEKLNCFLQGQIVPYPGNVSTVQYFQQFMNKHRIQSKVALVDEEKETTFGQLDEISTKLALAIKSIAEKQKLENKNPDGDWVVGLCLPPCDRLLYSIFAIHKLGCAYVPIDRTFPENRVVGITSSSRPILIISDGVESTLEKFKIVADELPTISYAELFPIAEKIELGPVDPFPSAKDMSERIAIILYTSGSSGPPKGVRLSHRYVKT